MSVDGGFHRSIPVFRQSLNSWGTADFCMTFTPDYGLEYVAGVLHGSAPLHSAEAISTQNAGNRSVDIRLSVAVVGLHSRHYLPPFTHGQQFAHWPHFRWRGCFTCFLHLGQTFILLIPFLVLIL